MGGGIGLSTLLLLELFNFIYVFFFGILLKGFSNKKKEEIAFGIPKGEARAEQDSPKVPLAAEGDLPSAEVLGGIGDRGGKVGTAPWERVHRQAALHYLMQYSSRFTIFYLFFIFCGGASQFSVDDGFYHL